MVALVAAQGCLNNDIVTAPAPEVDEILLIGQDVGSPQEENIDAMTFALEVWLVLRKKKRTVVIDQKKRL